MNPAGPKLSLSPKRLYFWNITVIRRSQDAVKRFQVQAQQWHREAEHIKGYEDGSAGDHGNCEICCEMAERSTKHSSIIVPERSRPPSIERFAFCDTLQRVRAQRAPMCL